MLYIAENLRKLRKEKNLTQEVVAEMLGVSAQSVNKWERGDTLPDITLLPALANLSANVAYILFTSAICIFLAVKKNQVC